MNERNKANNIEVNIIPLLLKKNVHEITTYSIFVFNST